MATVRRRDALEYHRGQRPGKIQVVATKALTSQRDLSLAYSPGVAEPCLEIHKDPGAAYAYTARGNLVAVITNGTAVLGLGDIGPLASKPVMEGKGVLFKKFADIDVFDLELDAKDPDRFVDCVCALAPTFGGINLEDVKAPECFYIESELRKRLDIPVFHDDQHGTAIISGAALLNAVELQGKKLSELRMVVSGAGASAVACTRFYCRLGISIENVLMCDSKGVLHHERTDLNEEKREFARRTNARTLSEALVGADLFLGLSRGGLVDAAMVSTMAERPIVFALANPDPEIGYDEAKGAAPNAVVATGRSDFPNQVNNVLGFPGIFRGALDVRAKTVNEAMKIAAARALAELTRKDVPQVVNRAYGEEFRFGPDYIIPKPFDPRVVQWVAPAVAQAAAESGVAREPVELDEYRQRLSGLTGGSTAIMRKFVTRAQRAPQRILFPESHDARILKACTILVDEGIAEPVLLGSRERIIKDVQKHDLELDLDRVSIVEPARDPRFSDFVAKYHVQRQRKGVDEIAARETMRRRTPFGMMMVAEGFADGIVTGMCHSYPDSIRPALSIIGLAPGGRRTAGMYLMLHRRGMLFFADTTVNVSTSADVLADVAEMVADAASTTFEIHPRVAFLSYGNFGSARTAGAEGVRRAVEQLHRRRPDLEVEGELQANVAVDYALQKRNHPFTRLTGPANVLIFPNLEAGNAAYKLMRELGEVPAVGPVLLGMDKPVTVLERDCSVDNVVQMTALTVVQAQLRSRERARAGF
ncbi:MAG: NADP-dependent malic enzyme [Myxococcales bacterium FL481]|nr:MAG: NADP-dependent malic enzyme [Myxococcales bacterium FL481]